MNMTIYYVVYGILGGILAIAAIQYFALRLSKTTRNFFSETVLDRIGISFVGGALLVISLFLSILFTILSVCGVFKEYYYWGSTPIVVAYLLLIALSVFVEYDRKYDYIHKGEKTFKNEIKNSKWSIFTKFVIFVWGLTKRIINPLMILYFINRMFFYIRNSFMLIFVKYFYAPISKEKFFDRFKTIFNDELDSRFKSRCSMFELKNHEKEFYRAIIGMSTGVTIYRAMKEKEDGTIYKYYLIRFANLAGEPFINKLAERNVISKRNNFVGIDIKLDEKIYLVDSSKPNSEVKLIDKDSEFINVDKSKTRLEIRELYDGWLVTAKCESYYPQPNKEIEKEPFKNELRLPVQKPFESSEEYNEKIRKCFEKKDTLDY